MSSSNTEKVKTTPYAKAWVSYKETEDYKKSFKEMKKHGMQMPYIDNILRLAFDAGYNVQKEK